MTETAAAEFGLAPSTLIAAGCGDTAANALGAGIVQSGMLFDVAGTASVLAASTDTFMADVENWNKKIGPSTWKWGHSTIELTNGDLLTCGKHTVSGYNQVLLVKTDNAGNIIWEKELGVNNLSEEGNSVKQNSDGSFTIAGTCLMFQQDRQIF